MVVKAFLLRIEGSDESKLQTIKDWLNIQIDKTDLNEGLSDKDLYFHYEREIDEYALGISLFIKNNKSIVKYINFVKNKFKSFNKDGLSKIIVLRYDNCTHDEVNPQPCNYTEAYSWQS